MDPGGSPYERERRVSGYGEAGMHVPPSTTSQHPSSPTYILQEHLGTGRAAQSEAGKKGGEIFKEPGAGIMADPAGREGKKKGGVKATKEGIQEEE